MNNKLFFPLLFFIFGFIGLSAQNEQSLPWYTGNHLLHLEGGSYFMGGDIKEDLSIRQNISYYEASQYSPGIITPETKTYLFGIKYEYHLPHFNSGISTGIRFIGLQNELIGYTSRVSRFFYLRYSESDSDTKFARISSLMENYYALTVPFELRIGLYQFTGINFFAKAGVEYSLINFKKEVNIQFQEETMMPYHNMLVQEITDPANTHFATFYSSLGISFGKNDKINFALEVLLPSFVLTDNNFHLLDIKEFDGIKLSVYFPVSPFKTNNR
ncbi:MAG: hypothetical protein WCR58_05905 [Bacteroidales bacterium]|jgi:hypothetical protein|nr:hypothetical protein [Bacteroidales bacterium]MDD3701540.1 hypothetical protein [Bacteroidales bacterium]MDY0369268.1 hypothetical protein [Bacteroidales bacterium]